MYTQKYVVKFTKLAKKDGIKYLQGYNTVLKNEV